MSDSFTGRPIEIFLELRKAIEEQYEEQETYTEEVVVKESGWFSKAVTEIRSQTRTVTKTRNVIKLVSVNFEFCAIPAGTFLMGSTTEAPAHQVNISHDFYLGKFAVTQAQWEAVMGNNPSSFKEVARPVEQISWEDCQEYIKVLNTAGKGSFRLPTEAEWEYACRAGSSETFCFGEDKNQLEDYAWYNANSHGETHPVGQKKPNKMGLYDMHGNVWEWCQDWYDDYSADSTTDPQGPTFSSMPVRVFRGGCWRGGPDFAAAAHRSGRGPAYRSNVLGVRLVYIPVH
jgi:formylglycine-generating enzyme required for sulfatase activity